MRRCTRITLSFCMLVCSARVLAAPAASKRGAVATPSEKGTQAAIDILRKGGNAFDAAVAAAFTMGVTNGFSSGIGGGGFLVGFQADKASTFALDFREVAPRNARMEMFLGPDGKPIPEKSRDGALSVAVPGAAMGYVEIQKRYGKLKLPEVLAPAIKAAEEGFLVTPHFQKAATMRLECLRADPESSRLFLQKQKGAEKPEVPELGYRILQKDLGTTLRAIAKAGSHAFYEGKIAKLLVKAVADGGGVMTEEDLKIFAVRDRAPLMGSYRGHVVATMPPPSAGGIAVLQVLNVLEHADLSTGYHVPAHLHLYAEAVKQSYADRAMYLGDPGFVKVPLDPLISKQYGDELFARFSGKGAQPAAKVVPWREGDHTSHLSVVDAEGNAASITTTVNYIFGSCVVAKGTGVLLNDEMDDFAAKPGTPNTYGLVTGDANAVAPGKIPLSSMSPTIVFQKGDPKRVQLVVGSPGGAFIPTIVIQAIVNVLDYGMPLDQALSTPRLHHQYLPDVLMAEPNALESKTLEALTLMGHKIEQREAWGDAHAVMVDAETGVRFAASDSRGEGRAQGE